MERAVLHTARLHMSNLYMTVLDGCGVPLALPLDGQAPRRLSGWSLAVWCLRCALSALPLVVAAPGSGSAIAFRSSALGSSGRYGNRSDKVFPPPLACPLPEAFWGPNA